MSYICITLWRIEHDQFHATFRMIVSDILVKLLLTQRSFSAQMSTKADTFLLMIAKAAKVWFLTFYIGFKTHTDHIALTALCLKVKFDWKSMASQ